MRHSHRFHAPFQRGGMTGGELRVEPVFRLPSSARTGAPHGRSLLDVAWTESGVAGTTPRRTTLVADSGGSSESCHPGRLGRPKG